MLLLEYNTARLFHQYRIASNFCGRKLIGGNEFRALAAEARGVLGSTPGDCWFFLLTSIFAS